MQGVTAAIVAFVFVCIAIPSLVRNRPQFYGAVALVLGVILLDALGFMIGTRGFRVFAYLMIALLQVGSIALLILSVGGMTGRDLAGELSRAYEVMRRGEEEKEIIIPLSGQAPPPRETQQEPERTVYRIDDEESKADEQERPADREG